MLFSGGPSKLREFRRTNSVDAVHTGCKGLLRSDDWRTESKLKDANDGEASTERINTGKTISLSF
jgi:hypothetical protein